MKAHVQVGSEVSYSLRDALLIYSRRSNMGSQEDVFVTRHGVVEGSNAAPQLGPAENLSMEFVSNLLRSLTGAMSAQLLPENVLVHSVDRVIWWSEPSIRTMFYADYSRGSSAMEKMPELKLLSGKKFPQPALLYEIRGGNLYIRALAAAERPTMKTKLFTAPYWNVSDNGIVCLGDTRAPENADLATLTRWEESFFESAFSHQNARNKLTVHPKGFIGLWKELAGKNSFPANYLAPAGQTLKDYLASNV
jgi:PRTRC genetic system protein B